MTLLILNIAFIWGNSLLSAEASQAFSDWVKDILFPGRDGNGLRQGSGLLRKIAHFTEFTCLGMCLTWLFGMLREKKAERLLLPLAAGITAAAIDETIQLFVPLRGPSVKDVGIDTAGVILGIVIITLSIVIKKKKQNKLLEEKTL